MDVPKTTVISNLKVTEHSIILPPLIELSMSESKLSDLQKTKLAVLEPKLKEAVRNRNYDYAKDLTLKIQNLLRPTGHEMRLMQAKNWLAEAAIECHDYQTAELILKANCDKSSDQTRLHLEATSLLAICYIRQKKMDLAEPLMSKTLRNDKVIRSKSKRTEFRLHMIKRFEEEGVISAIQDTASDEDLDPKTVEKEAGSLLMENTSEEELHQKIGSSAPTPVKNIIIRIDNYSRKQLSYNEVKLLPSPEDKKSDEKVGKTIASSLKRVLHKSLCNKESEIYQAWMKGGFWTVLNKAYIGGAIIAMLKDLKAGSYALAASLAAMVIKFGIEVWCDLNKPDDILLR